MLLRIMIVTNVRVKEVALHAPGVCKPRQAGRSRNETYNTTFGFTGDDSHGSHTELSSDWTMTRRWTMGQQRGRQKSKYPGESWNLVDFGQRSALKAVMSAQAQVCCLLQVALSTPCADVSMLLPSLTRTGELLTASSYPNHQAQAAAHRFPGA